MDSINSRTHSVEDVRADLAESRVAKVETTAPVAETPKADETPQVQAQKAAPEIDKLRTANKELAQTWTDIVAAEDGTIQEAPEVDWSAWERAERGLPPGESTSSTAVIKEMPAVAGSVGTPPGEVASKPELSPRDWTPEGYQPPQPDTLRTADVKIHQVAPGVFVDDNWNRVETPNQTMFDMEGNPIAVAPPALTGLPDGWTVDPKNGAILDGTGQPMGSPSQLTPTQLEEVRAQLGDIQLVPKLSHEHIQRLVAGRSSSSEIKVNESAIAPPPGKSMLASLAAQVAAQMDSEVSTSAPDGKGFNRAIAPPPGKVIGDAELERPGALASGVSGVATSSLVNSDGETVVSMPASVPKNSGRQIAPPPGKVIGAASSSVPLAAPTGEVKDGVVSMAAAQPPRLVPDKLESITEYRQFEEYLKKVDAKMDEKFAQEYEPEPTMLAPRFRGLAQNTQAAAREQILSDFVDSETGLSYTEIKTIQNRMASWKEGLLNRERPDNDNYGPNAKDRELLANANAPEIQARFQSYMAGIPDTVYTQELESGVGTYTMPPSEAERQAFAAQFVDPATGISGTDLQRLDRVLQEKKQYDRAANELEFFKLGSFTDNDKVSKIDASKVFTPVGHDKRLELFKDGSQPLGKAHVLADGRLVLADEHETGVFYVSRFQTSELQALGVIDTNNGGLNIDGLYLNGSAHIGTERPKGGFFGKVLNTIGHILPGGKIGELTADAISDVNQLVNRPAKEFLEALGQDKDDFSMQLLLHQEANIDVLAHARETRGKTFDELVKRTAEYGAVDRAANAVGKVLVASNIPIVNLIGAGIVVASGAVIAGQAQMQGDRSANANSGIKDAVTAYFTGQLTAGVGNMASNAAASYLKDAGELAKFTGELSTFASSFASNLATQAASGEGDIDLAGAFEAGLLGAVGMRTTISGTGMNAVQLAQFGESVRKAEETGDWSGVASSLAGFITAPFKPKEPNAFERFFGVGAAASSAPSATPQGGEAPAGGPQSGGGPEQREPVGNPVADDPAAGGPQSGGGPEEPEAGPRDPRAGLRAVENRIGDQVIQGPDGSWMTVNSEAGLVRLERVDDQGRTVVTRFGDDGTFAGQRISSPGGLVLEVNSDSRVLRIETADAGRKGFDEAFAAARAQGAGAFSWNGRTFHTGTADQVSAAVQSFAQQNRAALDELSPHIQAAVLTRAATLVENGYSNHAISIERGVVENQAGFDSSGLGTGLSEALAQGRALQAAFLAENQRELAQLNRHQPPATGSSSPAPAVDSSSSTFVNPDVDFGAALGDMQGTPTQAVVGPANTGSMLVDAFVDHFNNLGTNMGNAARSTTAEGLGAAAAAAYNRLVDGTSRVIQYVAETPLEQMAADFQDLDRRITQKIIDNPVGALLAVGNAVVPLGDIYEASAAMGGRVLSDEEARAQTVKLLGGVGGVLGAVPGAGLVGRAAGAADDVGDLARVGGNVGRNTPPVHGGPDVPAPSQSVRSGTPEAPSGSVRADGNAPATPREVDADLTPSSPRPVVDIDLNNPRVGSAPVDIDLYDIREGFEINAAFGPRRLNLESTGDKQWRTVPGDGPPYEVTEFINKDGIKLEEVRHGNNHFVTRPPQDILRETTDVDLVVIPNAGPPGRGLQVHGGVDAKQLEHLNSALMDLPPLFRQALIKDIHVTDELGHILYPNGSTSPIVGLALEKGEILLPRGSLSTPEAARFVIHHEVTHNLDKFYQGQSSKPPWGVGPSISNYGNVNAGEDFAEFGRVVLGDWKRLSRLTEADWAIEPFASKKMEMVRLFGGQLP